MSVTIYRVIRILNSKTVVTNAGSIDGFEKGDILEIYEDPEPIIDPESNEILGALPQQKGLIRIIDVSERMSVCENVQREEISNPANVLNAWKVETKVADLPVDRGQINRLPIDGQPITISDKVRLYKKSKDSTLFNPYRPK